MAKACGKNFILQIETAPAVFTTVGGLRSNSFTRSNEAVDVTTKGDAPDRQLLACGIRSVSISGDGIMEDNTALLAVEEAANSSTITNFKLISEFGDEYEGPFLVTSFERSGDYNNSEEFSLSLESAAAITHTPAP